MKKNLQISNNIESVILTIYTQDKKLDIPLEIWQVDAICEVLGLCVDTTNLETYKMRSKELVEKDRKMYHKFIKDLNEKERNNDKKISS